MNKKDNAQYLFDQIIQVIGAAHTFRPSLAIRHYLTKDISGYHSAQNYEFSYFYKGDKDTIVRSNKSLRLRTDPQTKKLAKHWSEPELAIFLGNDHKIIAVTLANDLTAISVESQGRTENTDNTFNGKTWKSSGSLGPNFILADQIDDISKLDIELNMFRNDSLLYKQSYSLSKCLFSLKQIPGMIVDLYFKKYSASDLPSKRIMLDSKKQLPYGTVIMLGTGIIVPPRYYCKPNDKIVISCHGIGKLTNLLSR
jgi:2-keto-4-pentenoate hydratase/2-oxohepta-3-ene-1,7-dioic acid hydratase in catechol pathway